MTEPSEPELSRPAELPADFSAFFEQKQKTFLAQACSRLRSYHDAEEAVLEAGLRIYSKWERILAAENPEALMQKILHGVIVDHWRRMAKRRMRECPLDGVTGSVQLLELRSHDKLDRALEALEVVAPMQAQCVRLHHIVDLPYEEVARRLNISLSAAKTNAHLGRQRLKEIMSPADGGEGA
ncbi:RNA polymerase sigma factor [Streptomyces gobiensis]|uniref:RNA polymerase sigma factor n=1 Tax=Streptomyces gobiensis TaxID=2875706 RepID=UPI001E369645|nr:RNA polymerase sigma factor [Streptomyces gobiensis]UGY93080.1 RNA polymerase sigma factor [Streptomyces gobiensis]